MEGAELGHLPFVRLAGVNVDHSEPLSKSRCPESDRCRRPQNRFDRSLRVGSVPDGNGLGPSYSILNAFGILLIRNREFVHAFAATCPVPACRCLKTTLRRPC